MANPSPNPATRFQPGQTGNPKGRPQGLARQARAAVGDDGQKLVAFWLRVMRNTKAPLSSRIEASRLLADRGWGKAPQHEPVKDGDPLALEGVDQEIATLMDELAGRRKAKAARPAPKRAVARAGSNGRGRD